MHKQMCEKERARTHWNLREVALSIELAGHMFVIPFSKWCAGTGNKIYDETD